MTASIDVEDLRNLLLRMGQTGQPPERGAMRVNVGTDKLLATLDKEVLDPIRAYGRNSAFKLVQATYGGGKTQFLHCLREIAWDKGLAVSLVGLSPQHCPFDDLATIYKNVAQAVELAPDDPHAMPDRGIDAVLRTVVERKLATVEHKDEVRKWLHDQVDRARVESHAFRRAGVRFMEAVLDRDREHEDLLGSYLRGEDVELSEVKGMGVRETLESKSALRFLLSLVQFLRAAGLPGLLVLFDEMDRVMSLTAKRRMILADNLRELIDSTGQSRLPGMLWVYAVPPEFVTNIVPEYPALEQRLRGAARFSNVNPLAPIIDLDHLGSDPVKFLEEIGLRLYDIHEEAFSAGLDREMQHGNIKALAKRLGATQLESGTRRSFVKAVVQMLCAQRLAEQRKLTDKEIAELCGAPSTSTMRAPTSSRARAEDDDGAPRRDDDPDAIEDVKDDDDDDDGEPNLDDEDVF